MKIVVQMVVALKDIVYLCFVLYMLNSCINANGTIFDYSVVIRFHLVLCM